jgi:20S proteasome alpha/beta subunit
LTTVIGIKCSDGIVIGTDSQATARTGRTKDLRVDKILQINKFCALAGSGDSDHVKTLLSALRRRIGNKIFDDDEMVENLESVLNGLYKKYNVEKSKAMGLPQMNVMFHPSSILGAKLKNGTFGLYILKDDGFVSRVDNYAAIGSGTDLAKLVLDIQSRAPASQQLILADLSFELNWFTACVTVNEVKNFDGQSGGDTRIAIITGNGLTKLSNEAVTRAYEWYIEQISTLFSRGLKDRTVKNMVRGFFRR